MDNVVRRADFDECDYVNYGQRCADDANCTNTVGGFICECWPGFTGDGTTCTSQYRYSIIRLPTACVAELPAYPLFVGTHFTTFHVFPAILRGAGERFPVCASLTVFPFSGGFLYALPFCRYNALK